MSLIITLMSNPFPLNFFASSSIDASFSFASSRDVAPTKSEADKPVFGAASSSLERAFAS